MRLLATFLLLLSVLTSSVRGNDWLIVPGVRAGVIQGGVSETGLRTILGRDNLRRDTISTGEGAQESGVIAFPGESTQRLEIWFSPNRGVETVRIKGDKSLWKFEGGLTLGTTLKQLEVWNGRPFQISGWGWEFAGAVMSWQGGELESSFPVGVLGQRVWMRLTAPNRVWRDLGEVEGGSLMGSEAHLSSEPAIQKLNPKVSIITVQLAELATRPK